MKTDSMSSSGIGYGKQWNMDQYQSQSVPREGRKVSYAKDSEQAIRKAMNLLLYRPRSEAELAEKLRQTGFESKDVSQALEYVRSFGYLNDQHFAENYVHSYQTKKSRSVMRMELRSKGVDEIYIEQALESIPADEKKIMLDLILKKNGRPHRLNEQEYRRSSGYLARKGYAGSDIARVLRKYQSMSEDE